MAKGITTISGGFGLFLNSASGAKHAKMPKLKTRIAGNPEIRSTMVYLMKFISFPP
jgi:hypothetical protein